MKKPYAIFIILIVVLISIFGLYRKKLEPSLNFIQYGTTTSMANRGNIGGPRAVTEAEELRLNQAREVSNFPSKILSLSFDHPARWGQLTEKIDPPYEKRPYENWELSGAGSLSFQTITPSTTPYRWEGPEIFSYTKLPLETLCENYEFINITYLEDPQINCVVKYNKNNIPYLKFSLSFYTNYIDRTHWIIDGALFKTKSETFPLLAIFYQRQPDYTDLNKYAETLKALDMVTNNLSYN